MVVLFLDAYYPPEITADTHLEQDLIDGMIAKGWNVYVVCPTPTRGISKNVIAKYKRIKVEKQKNGKVIVHRFWAPQEGTKSSIRALRYMWCCLRQIQIGKHLKRVDVIYCNSTPPIQGLAAKRIKKKHKCKFVYSLQDLFPDSLVTAGISNKDSLAYKLGLKIEKRTYESCDEIITLSKSMKKTLLGKGLMDKQLHVVYNWIDTNAVYPVGKKNNTLFEELDIDRDKFTVLYAGNMGKSQNIDYIIDAAKRLMNEDGIQFALFGAGSEAVRIEKRIHDEKLRNTYMFPLLSVERVSEVYSLGDVDLICNAPGISMIGMPSKTWTIMATGTPIIAAIDKECELANMISAFDCGWIVDPTDSAALVDAICKLKNDMQIRNLMGKNSRKYAVDVVGKETAVGKYLDIISKQLTK